MDIMHSCERRTLRARSHTRYCCCMWVCIGPNVPTQQSSGMLFYIEMTIIATVQMKSTATSFFLLQILLYWVSRCESQVLCAVCFLFFFLFVLVVQFSRSPCLCLSFSHRPRFASHRLDPIFRILKSVCYSSHTHGALTRTHTTHTHSHSRPMTIYATVCERAREKYILQLYIFVNSSRESAHTTWRSLRTQKKPLYFYTTYFPIFLYLHTSPLSVLHTEIKKYSNKN